jgi:protein TonB
MKISKNDFGIAGQSTTEAKKSQKHDANLQKNSILYFQIGLILCLLGTYALFEMQFQTTTITLSDETAKVETISIDDVEPFVVEVIKPKDSKPLPSADLKDVYEEVKDDSLIKEVFIKTPEDPKVSDNPVAKIDEIYDGSEESPDPVFVPIALIEKVPVYPGCEKHKTNVKLKKCMSQKIAKLIGKKFNVDIGSDYGISGRQKISTQFTIDKNGDVTDIKIRGPHHALENEAKRVIHKIPKMEPGLQSNVPVGVIYTLPIVYDARD